MVKKHFDNFHYVSVKNTFENIIKHGELINSVSDIVQRTHLIVFHLYNFIKLFYLHLINLNYRIFPTLNVQFIQNIINIITYKKEKQGSKILSNHQTDVLNAFYQFHYRPLLENSDIICRDKLKHVLYYEGQDIIKNISTNIREHFFSHLKFFIRVRFKFHLKIDKIKSSKKLKGKDKHKQYSKIYDTINNIFFDIINITDDDFQSNEKYHIDIKQFRKDFIPIKEKYGKNSVLYDIQAKPLDYIVQMIMINRKLEIINQFTILDTEGKIKSKSIPFCPWTEGNINYLMHFL